MTDTKISAQTAVSPVLGTYEMPLNAGGVPRKATMANVQIFVNSMPVWAAGSAAAASWPKFTPGTILTTPEAGAIELDTTNLYGTVEASNRGIIPIEHFIMLAAANTMVSNTSAQPIFNSPTNGQLTITPGRYLFECLLVVNSMSATNGSGNFGLIGAGTATIPAITQFMFGADQAQGAAGALSGLLSGSATPPQPVLPSTATDLMLIVKGQFKCTVAGTIIPSFTLTTAAAAIIAQGTYFSCKRIGASGVVSVGNWS